MNATVIIVLMALLVRFILAAGSGLGIDESYMVAATTHFSASYFEHPLVSWWLELGARHLFGSSAPLIVRLPFVLLSGVSSWLLYLITKRLFNHRAGFWAVVAYVISPVFSLAFGTWVLPDGPLDAALFACLYALIRALGLPDAKPAIRWWLLAGVFAGLAMLSKYNAGLILLGIAIAVLLDPVGRQQLFSPWPWLGVCLALALASPILIWNIQHHWISFDYQGGRALGLKLRPLMPLTIWGGEALYVLPWLWVPMIWVMVRSLAAGPKARTGWLLAWASLLPILLFALFGLWSQARILYHWATPGYLMLFPLIGDWATRQRQTVLKAVAWASAGLLVLAVFLIVALTQLGLPPELAQHFKGSKSAMLQAVDWTSIGKDLPLGIDAVAAQRWYDAGKIGYALRRDGVDTPVTVFGPQAHQFALTAPASSLLGKTVLVVALPGSPAQTYARFVADFASLKPGPTLQVVSHGTVLRALPTFIGTDMQKVPRQ